MIGDARSAGHGNVEAASYRQEVGRRAVDRVDRVFPRGGSAIPRAAGRATPEPSPAGLHRLSADDDAVCRAASSSCWGAAARREPHHCH